MECHSPVRSGGDLFSLEGLSVLELLAACSRCGLSTEGDRLVLRRRLAEYQAHPSPPGLASREEEECRWWLGTAGAGWLRVPFSFVVSLPSLVVQQFLESRGFPRAVIELSVRDHFLDVAQQVWEELMFPVSGSFFPGPVEYFELLVRTSGSVLLGLSRTVQALFKEAVCDGLPTGTTVTMFLRHCVAADMVNYVVQSHGSSGCVVWRTDGKVTRDFPTHGLVVPGAVVLVRVAVAARSGALGLPAASVFASTVPLPPAAGVFPGAYMGGLPSVPSAVSSVPSISVPVGPGPSDWLSSHMQVALQLDDRAERNKNKKKHHTRQVSDVLRYDRV